MLSRVPRSILSTITMVFHYSIQILAHLYLAFIYPLTPLHIRMPVPEVIPVTFDQLAAGL